MRLRTRAARAPHSRATERTLVLIGSSDSAPSSGCLDAPITEVRLDAVGPTTGYRVTVTLTVADDPEILDSLIERLRALRASRCWLQQQADRAAERALEGK